MCVGVGVGVGVGMGVGMHGCGCAWVWVCMGVGVLCVVLWVGRWVFACCGFISDLQKLSKA